MLTSSRAEAVVRWLDEKHESRTANERAEVLRLEPTVLAMLVGHHALGGYTSQEFPLMVGVVRAWMEAKTAASKGP